jgi:hypothetical protein
MQRPSEATPFTALTGCRAAPYTPAKAQRCSPPRLARGSSFASLMIREKKALMSFYDEAGDVNRTRV